MAAGIAVIRKTRQPRDPVLVGRQVLSTTGVAVRTPQQLRGSDTPRVNIAEQW